MRPFRGDHAKGRRATNQETLLAPMPYAMSHLCGSKSNIVRKNRRTNYLFLRENIRVRWLAFKLPLSNHVGASKEGTMCTCRTALTAMSLGMLSLLCAPATQAQLQSGNAQTVTGQVSAVEGEFHMAKDYRGEDILRMVDKSYIVTTPTGQQIELKLTRETKVPARANPGDRIEARITEKGQTLSVQLIGDAADTR